MKYYKVVKDDIFDWDTGCFTILNELVTPRERAKRFPNIRGSAFVEVEIKKTDTYWFFGARFADDVDGRSDNH